MKELYKAIYNIQSKLQKIEKTSKNPFFKSKYVPLDKVWGALQPLLEENKLIVLQNPISSDLGLGVETVIIEIETGQELKSSYVLPMVKKDPQAGGSALTYARRYSLMSIFGLCPVDDDGEQATRPPKKTEKPSKFEWVKKKNAELAPTKDNKEVEKRGINEYWQTMTKIEQSLIMGTFNLKYKGI